MSIIELLKIFFCKSFSADNLSRSDTAFDASYKSIGVGLKTFTCPTNASTEKVAEFNSLSRELGNFSGKELALKLAGYRNERIDLANRLYNISNSLYHIVARKDHPPKSASITIRRLLK